ncbi:hypothetical protein GCM10027445_44970 [Amycolatopsis endophytica]|uniref:Putative MFS family arabinose efflux permease n=1 Tax=Amycolatopsis endophytica TaxID=860233 RepID=A0A853B1F4_9PSEU|nr:hypothetical protein [Amycolatopsis endophytica]NYI88611.1 putative MFS family arabinose efflux permease [Amycolatopsis endophytica]
MLDATTPVAVVAVLFLVMGAGMGLALPATNLVALAAVPPERSGVASATVNAARQTGTALGVAVLGTIVASSGRITTGLVVAGVATLAVSVVLATRMRGE